MSEGIEGVHTYVDDILVWGTTQNEHDKCLKEVLSRAWQNNLKLNKDKCKEALLTSITLVMY